jgi:hypothetical protein
MVRVRRHHRYTAFVLTDALGVLIPRVFLSDYSCGDALQRKDSPLC